jgi:transposase
VWEAVPVGETRRRLSLFVMVLCYSRMLYVEFTLSQTMEQFLACHQNAFGCGSSETTGFDKETRA